MEMSLKFDRIVTRVLNRHQHGDGEGQWNYQVKTRRLFLVEDNMSIQLNFCELSAAVIDVVIRIIESFSDKV